jgi:prevent-host-death family protein
LPTGGASADSAEKTKCIPFPIKKGYIARMADTYTIKTAQQKLSALVEEAADHPVTITKQGRAVAVLVSIERMEAIGETMELLADPNAMSAIRKHREGTAKYHDVSVLDEP